jgi:hypothetical protein
VLLACKPSSFTLTDHPRPFATQPTQSKPLFVFGARGDAHVEITVYGANRGLHTGLSFANSLSEASD